MVEKIKLVEITEKIFETAVERLCEHRSALTSIAATGKICIKAEC
jgi:hypothetical protein